MTIQNRACVAVLLGALALSGCDLLDVKNPNNLVEESIREEVAAGSVVNGAQALVSEAVSESWQPYLVASDELYWIGSRDGWGQLDKGFVTNPTNEFIDGHFPGLGESRWMSDEAIEIVTEHLGNNPGSTSLEMDLARANVYSGIIYMVIGEIQEDFAFSDRREAFPPVGPANMYQVLDAAIARFDAAVDGFTALGEPALVRDVRALRSRAHQSRAIWDVINPVGTAALVSSAAAGADAAAVLAVVGNGAEWRYNLTYPSGAPDNGMAQWINDRKENQIDQSLVTVDEDFAVTGVALQDPIDGIPDPALTRNIQQWKGASGALGAVTDAGTVRPDLTLASTQLMHLILAENALAAAPAGNAAFEAQINYIRGMSMNTTGATAVPMTPYTIGGAGMPSPIEMLQHTRKVNTFLQGLRLADMYRWDIQPSTATGSVSTAVWEPASEAASAPGTMLSLAIIEIRANCFLNGSC